MLYWSSEFNIISHWTLVTRFSLAYNPTRDDALQYIYIRKKKVYSARSIGEEVWITWTDIECSLFTLPHQVQACTGHLPNVKSFVCTTHFVSKWFSRCMFDKFVIFIMDFMWHIQNELCRKDPFPPTCDDSWPSLINFAKLDNMLMYICVIFNCKVMGIMRC